ncbi:MAG: hypothetical protein Q9224_004761 [Gallowayella concinna]
MSINPVTRHSLHGLLLFLLSSLILLSFSLVKRDGASSENPRIDHVAYDAVIDNDSENSQTEWQTFNSTLLKRDTAADYEKAKKKGKDLWTLVQCAMDGQGDAGEVFQPSALDNGWTRTLDEKRDLEDHWRDYFELELTREKVPRKIPSKDHISFIQLEQTGSFTDRQGKPAGSPAGPQGKPLYYSYYVPSISAVIVKTMFSPANILTKLLTSAGEEVPSSQMIKDHLVPPLSRWSDVTWVLYSDLARKSSGEQLGKLQYLAHDMVTNGDTKVVMIYIMRKHQKNVGRLQMPFPGLEFDIETEEGQALLGTPNGVGTAWMMHDRARELGKRGLKIRLWQMGSANKASVYLAFNMVPV